MIARATIVIIALTRAMSSDAAVPLTWFASIEFLV